MSCPEEFFAGSLLARRLVNRCCPPPPFCWRQPSSAQPPEHVGSAGGWGICSAEANRSQGLRRLLRTSTSRIRIQQTTTTGSSSSFDSAAAAVSVGRQPGGTGWLAGRPKSIQHNKKRRRGGGRRSSSPL